MYYLYELRDRESNIVYIGQSKTPEWRLYDHTKRNPLKSPKAGKFYGQDLHLIIVDEYETRREALNAEKSHKTFHGHELTEALGALNFVELSHERIECEHCGMSNNPGNHYHWHGDNCKQATLSPLPYSLTQ